MFEWLSYKMHISKLCMEYDYAIFILVLISQILLHSEYGWKGKPPRKIELHKFRYPEVQLESPSDILI